MKIALVGATGLVGQKMLEILAERAFPYSEIIPVASERSVGKKLTYNDAEYTIVSVADAIAERPSLALFSAGGAISLEQAPAFAEVGTRVVDNSSAWRMDVSKKLIVPEVNADALTEQDYIIANPNCSTIQLVVALKPLHDVFKIKRIVISTYQSVSGTGAKGVQQLQDERSGNNTGSRIYPYNIDLNVLPHIDSFLENGYTKEEMKMVNETQKILGDNTIQITATAVRVPVWGGHSESVNVEFEHPIDLKKIRELLGSAPGVVLHDDPAQLHYPMPIDAHNKNEVFVGRLRIDFSQPNTLNMWIVSDNVRKGAATNAVQIAEYLLQQGWI